MKLGLMRFVSVLLVVLIAITTTSVYASERDISDDRKNKEKSSIAVYNDLIKSFEQQNQKSLYPDNYAGAYITDSGELVLLTSRHDDEVQPLDEMTDQGNILSDAVYIGSGQYRKMSSSFRSTVDRLVSSMSDKDRSSVLVQEAKYSYGQLQGTMDEIAGIIQESEVNDAEIILQSCMFYISDRENSVVVCTNNNNNSKISTITHAVTDSGMVKYSFNDCNIEDFVYLHSGEVFESMVTNGTAGSSIGYRARRYLGNNQYEYGFVTAGHSINAGQIAYRPVSVPIGICTVSAYSGIDAAFVKLYSGYTMSNITNHGNNLLQAGYTNSVQGATIYKEGMMTGITQGRVETTNANVTVGSNLFTNMLIAICYASYGDSGGVVYDSSNVIIGIVKGGDTQSGIISVTKASSIDQQFSVYPY